jgi:hypothetical protein
VRWKERLLFGGRGRQADADGGCGGIGDGKEEERAQQENTGGKREKWLGASVDWARGGQGGGARGRAGCLD